MQQPIFTSSYHLQCDGFVECISGVIMQIITVCVASDYKDWDTYRPSSTYAYNTSLSEETDETPFFLTYGHKPVTLPDVALLTPMIQSKSEDYYQEQLIGLIRTA